MTRFIVRQDADARPSEGGGVDHLGLSVTDLDAMLGELESDGATITTPRREVTGLFPIAFVVDPWGVRLKEPQHLGFHHIHLRTTDVEATMQAYHVVARVHGDPPDLADPPVIGERLGPARIDHEPRHGSPRGRPRHPPGVAEPRHGSVVAQ